MGLRLKGTGFSPYIHPTQRSRGFSPRGALFRNPAHSLRLKGRNSRLKGTGFSPYIYPTQTGRGFSPRGTLGASPLHPLNQPLRQLQLRPQHPLPPRHLAVIHLMVIPGQVQQPMQHQHLDLHRKRVPLLRRLRQRRCY